MFCLRLPESPAPDGIDARDYAANFQDFLTARPRGAPFFFWFGCTEAHRVYGAGLGRKAGKRLKDARVSHIHFAPTFRSAAGIEPPATMQGQDPWQNMVYHQTTGSGATFNRSLSPEERDRAAGRDAHKPE